MTFLPPAGAPDWSSQPIPASALLVATAVQHWPDGYTNLPVIDISRYNGIVMFLQGQAIGPRVRMYLQQTVDEAAMVLISEQTVSTKDQRRVIMQAPVVGRYMKLIALVHNLSGPTADFALSLYATTNTWVPPITLMDGLVDEAYQLAINAGQSIVFDQNPWTPGLHYLTVDGTFANWSATVTGYNENGTAVCNYLALNQSRAQLGVAYPFVVGGHEPRLTVQNNDGAARTCSLAWGIAP